MDSEGSEPGMKIARVRRTVPIFNLHCLFYCSLTICWPISSLVDVVGLSLFFFVASQALSPDDQVRYSVSGLLK